MDNRFSLGSKDDIVVTEDDIIARLLRAQSGASPQGTDDYRQVSARREERVEACGSRLE